MEARLISSDEFEETYKPYVKDDGSMVYDAAEMSSREGGPGANNWWTLVDVDGRLYLVPGIHYVNRMGYVVTRVPHNDAPIEVDWED